MKSTTYEALKTFDTRLHMAFPGATFRLIEPFEGYDVAVEVTLPVGKVTWHDRMQLAERPPQPWRRNTMSISVSLLRP